MSSTGPLARTEHLLTETLHGELLVYDLDGDIAVHLNPTAALVWRLCDGRHTVAELSASVAAELGIPADEEVVLMALDSLCEHGLLSSGYDERDGAAVALSRRRFFRRFGIAGAAAMKAPVVFSAIVPLASAAVSGGGGGGGGGGGNTGGFNNQPLNQGSGSGGNYP